MLVRRLGAGHDLTCQRAYSGYDIANTPVQDAGKDRKVQYQYQTPCTKSSAKYSNSAFLAWGGGGFI
jgi:hypothetical protein